MKNQNELLYNWLLFKRLVFKKGNRYFLRSGKRYLPMEPNVFREDAFIVTYGTEKIPDIMDEI